MGRRKRVFISYPSEGHKEAEAVRDWLKSSTCGIEAFVCHMDRHDFADRPREEQRAELEKELAACTDLVVLWSRSTHHAGWCGWELETFAGFHTQSEPSIFVYRLDGTPYTHPIEAIDLGSERPACLGRGRDVGVEHTEWRSLLGTATSEPTLPGDPTPGLLGDRTAKWLGLDAAGQVAPLLGRAGPSVLFSKPTPTEWSPLRWTVAVWLSVVMLGYSFAALQSIDAGARQVTLCLTIGLVGGVLLAALNGLRAGVIGGTAASTAGIVVSLGRAWLSGGEADDVVAGAAAAGALLGWTVLSHLATPEHSAPRHPRGWQTHFKAGLGAMAACAVLSLVLGFVTDDTLLYLFVGEEGVSRLAAVGIAPTLASTAGMVGFGALLGGLAGISGVIAVASRVADSRRDRDQWKPAVASSLLVLVGFTGLGAFVGFMAHPDQAVDPQSPLYAVYVGVLVALAAGGLIALPRSVGGVALSRDASAAYMLVTAVAALFLLHDHLSNLPFLRIARYDQLEPFTTELGKLEAGYLLGLSLPLVPLWAVLAAWHHPDLNAEARRESVGVRYAFSAVVGHIVVAIAIALAPALRPDEVMTPPSIQPTVVRIEPERPERQRPSRGAVGPSIGAEPAAGIELGDPESERPEGEHEMPEADEPEAEDAAARLRRESQEILAMENEQARNDRIYNMPREERNQLLYGDTEIRLPADVKWSFFRDYETRHPRIAQNVRRRRARERSDEVRERAVANTAATSAAQRELAEAAAVTGGITEADARFIDAAQNERMRGAQQTARQRFAEARDANQRTRDLDAEARDAEAPERMQDIRRRMNESTREANEATEAGRSSAAAAHEMATDLADRISAARGARAAARRAARGAWVRRHAGARGGSGAALRAHDNGPNSVRVVVAPGYQIHVTWRIGARDPVVVLGHGCGIASFRTGGGGGRTGGVTGRDGGVFVMTVPTSRHGRIDGRPRTRTTFGFEDAGDSDYDEPAVTVTATDMWRDSDPLGQE